MSSNNLDVFMPIVIFMGAAVASRWRTLAAIISPSKNLSLKIYHMNVVNNLLVKLGRLLTFVSMLLV